MANAGTILTEGEIRLMLLQRRAREQDGCPSRQRQPKSLSVPKVMKTEHRVVFDDNWGYIESKHNRERSWLKQTGGMYTI